MSYRDHLSGLDPVLLKRINQTQDEIDWIRSASGADLLRLATDQLGVKDIPGVFDGLSAVEVGNLTHADLLRSFEGQFPPGTKAAEELADQVQLCRAFADPAGVTALISYSVVEKVRKFPKVADDLRLGSNAGDVLDPFILAANFELLSERSLQKTVEHTASHKVLMKIEDLVGHLHERVLGYMRGNFRVPEPQGSRASGKEALDPLRNPFPGADVGQVPLPDRPDALRLYQVKSKTGSAKGGDGKRLGEQLIALEGRYGADTFYAAVVGNTLRGHRSKGAVSKASPKTAILVGEASLNELTQSAVGPELLLRVYQRAFRAAAEETGYVFSDLVGEMSADFEEEARAAGTDFLSAWLMNAVGGPMDQLDSRLTEGK